MHNRILKIASNDQLTGLANRRLFEERLAQAIAKCRRYGGSFALVCIDLDGFKPINDTYGHQSGDLVLKAVSERLLASVRAVDTVARLGGDEFILILDPAPNDLDDLKAICSRTLENIEKPIALEQVECSVSCSLGVAIFQKDGADADELFKSADQAMYLAKDEGKATFRFADSSFSES